MIAGLLLQDRAAVRETIDRILARKEFRPKDRGLAEWIAEKLEKVLRWIGDLLGISDAGSVRTMLMTFLVLAALAFAWMIVRALASRRGTEAPRLTASPAHDVRKATVDALRAAARDAEGRGDHLAALRALFRALVVGLSERGELAYRDAWTNRELLERGAPKREVLPLLAPLVPRLDAQSFGREPAGADDVARLAAICDRLLAAGASR